jgi:peroxiredoxin
MAIRTGDAAPDFSLPHRQGGATATVTLSENRGRHNTVLLFVPAAFSGACTEELCDVSGGLAGLEAEGAKVYGISSDTPFALEAWAKHAGIAFPLLSDRKLEAARAYGVVLDDFLGVGPAHQRSVFVVDKEGIVRHTEVTASPGDLPDLDAMRAALAGL